MASPQVERAILVVGFAGKLRVLKAVQLEQAHWRVLAYGMPLIEPFLDRDMRELVRIDKEALAIERTRRQLFPELNEEADQCPQPSVPAESTCRSATPA